MLRQAQVDPPVVSPCHYFDEIHGVLASTKQPMTEAAVAVAVAAVAEAVVAAEAVGEVAAAAVAEAVVAAEAVEEVEGPRLAPPA